MSSLTQKLKTRNQANAVDPILMEPNEKILKECHDLYTAEQNGLMKIGKDIGLQLLPPQKKITVMLLGNHSAGKSSFVNWYIEEHVQKTGVAIETQGFFFVTSGKRRESLTGNATLHVFPHFKPLSEIDGVIDYLTTEVSTSKQKKFSLVTFIDTPGLVDGDMKYPFNVNEAMLNFGLLCDLVLVFFDPIGQALCKRTLDIVEKINEKHPDRIRFYLSKADEAGHETDRQRVLMQIVQEVCKRPGLNKTGFDMPTIFIPNSTKQSRCSNQIENICSEIEKAIDQSVQSSLNQMEKDCKNILNVIKPALSKDRVSQKRNKKAKWQSLCLSLLGFLLPIVLLFQLMISSAPRAALISILGEELATSVVFYMTPCTNFWRNLSNDTQLATLASVLAMSGFLLLLSRIFGKTSPCLQKKSHKILSERQEYIESHVLAQKHKLYEEYLKQSLEDQDI